MKTSIISFKNRIARTNKKYKRLYIFGIMAFFLFIAISFPLKNSSISAYENLFSEKIRDRNGIAIRKFPNEKNLYSSRTENLPKNLEDLLIQKEDKFFYYHLGINPGSIIRALWSYVINENLGGSSTITQQLTKILLGNEQNRSLTNKVLESLYALSLEIHLTKKEILTMYINSVYLGNQAQGFSEASAIYFDKLPDELTEQEMIKLLATLSSPSSQNPWKKNNDTATISLAEALHIPLYDLNSTKSNSHSYQLPNYFEINSLEIACDRTCNLTIDSELNEGVREILNRNIEKAYFRGVKNGAVVIIKVPENELLTIVGSKDPLNSRNGSQINMALEPRPIGSTIKPFIYGKGFESGLRPYTLVYDREYKYPIATGFPLYPKNYDGQYRGVITLHEALANSLNVPTVKVLEYIGLTQFYDFLENDLDFIPIQDLHSYQFGIALGGLEMDLLTLTHYFTLFANKGVLKPLYVSNDNSAITIKPPQSNLEKEKQIFDPALIQLVNKILNDRKTGVNQFGLKSNLNLTQDNYAVKTGTSRDFHDSWVVGYTPDFVVGVWLGNSENTALDQVSGQSGAGSVWQEVMELLFASIYNKQTPFVFNGVADFLIEESIECGLPNDDIENYRDVLNDNKLILNPHHDDLFEFQQNTNIPLQSQTEVDWYIDGVFVGHGSSFDFKPSSQGTYEIEARDNENREIISIKILSKF